MNVLWPSSSIPRIYKTGTLTDKKVCMQGFSLKWQSIGNSQVRQKGSLKKIMEKKTHSGILCSGEKE